MFSYHFFPFFSPIFFYFFFPFFLFLSFSLSFFFFFWMGGGFNYHKSYLSKSSSSYFSELNEKLGWLEARINKRASAAGYWNKFWWHIDLKWFEPWRRPMLETTDSINYINSVPLHLVPIHSAIVWQKFVGFHIRNFPLLYTPTADSNRPADLIVQSKVILLYYIWVYVSLSLCLSVFLCICHCFVCSLFFNVCVCVEEELYRLHRRNPISIPGIIISLVTRECRVVEHMSTSNRNSWLCC